MSFTANSRDGASMRRDVDDTMPAAFPTAYHYGKITQTNALESPLLRLPAEVRLMIYEYTFANGIVDVLQARSRFEGDPQKRRSKYAFGLRFTCRQLHAETRSTFYKNYTVDLTGCRGILTPFKDIPLDEIVSVEAIRICWLAAMDIADSVRFEDPAWSEYFLKYVRGACGSLKRVAIRELCILDDIVGTSNVVGALKVAFKKPDLEVYDACLVGDGSCSHAREM